MMAKYKYAFLFFLLYFTCSSPAYAAKWDRLANQIGPRDGVLIADSSGKVIFQKNARVQRMPASTLKILTTLMSRHYLGNDFRFVTECYLDKEKNLKIKGYGDPLLISEVLPGIARAIHAETDRFHDLILDASYYASVIIPGVTSSLNPYDSPNGALCVNFNTVNFRRVSGQYASAEAQTPLLPFVTDRIRRSGLRQERIVLSAENNENLLYAGHLFRYFLKKEGVQTQGHIRTGTVHPDEDRLVYRHISAFPLDEVMARLLEYSNNFIANQLFIQCGIAAFGPPGNLEKGRKAAVLFCKNVLGTEEIQMEEGSGISRNNRISPLQMLKVLEKYAPHYRLLKHKGREYYKTGSLSGVKCRAGYVETSNGLYPFVILINTPGKTTDAAIKYILQELNY